MNQVRKLRSLIASVVFLTGCTAAVPTLEGGSTSRKVDPYLNLTSPTQSVFNQSSLNFSLSDLEDGATFKLYGTSDCSSPALSTQTSSGNFIYALPNEGIHSFYYQIISKDGDSGGCQNPVISYTYDSSPPPASGINTISPYYASTTQSPIFNFSASDVGPAGVDVTEVKITSTGVIAVDWTPITAGAQVTGSFTNDTTYYAYIRTRDLATNQGPEGVPVSWTVDSAPPIISTVNDGFDSFSTSKSPKITWDGSDSSGSGVQEYLLAIGTSPGGTDVLSWQSVGLVTNYTATGLTLNPTITYYASLKAIDNAGNISTIVTGDGWVVNSELWVPNNTVHAMAQKNNKLYIGGAFNYVGPNTGGGAILNTTGNISNTYNFKNLRINGIVNTAIPDGSGGFYIGGNFNKVGSVSKANIAHITSTGVVDPVFTASTNNVVNAMALSGSNLYVGGSFTSINGGGGAYLGAVDVISGSTSWTTALNSATNAIAISGTTLYLGGSFTQAFDGLNMQTRNRLAAYDIPSGNLLSFNPNANGAVNSLIIDGANLYMGGSFTTITGSTKNKIASVNKDTGAVNPSFDPNITGTSVYALALSGSTLFIGGSFSNVTGTTRLNFAAVDALTGSPISYAINPSFNSTIYSLFLNGPNLYVGGTFDLVNSSVRRNYLVGINASDGSILSAFDGQASEYVKTISSIGSDIFVGGSFKSIGGKIRENIAEIDLPTGEVTSTNFSLLPSSNSVKAIALHDNHLFLGGDFSTSSKSNLSRFNYDGSENSMASISAGGPVYSLLIDGNSLFVGGQFLSPRYSLFKLDSVDSSASLSTFNPWVGSVSDYVNTIVKDGNTLFIGGKFTQVNNAGVHGTAMTRINLAAIDLLSPLGTAVTMINHSTNVSGYSEIKTLAAYSGVLYIGGMAPSNCLQAINISDGLIAPRPSIGSCGGIYKIAAANDGTIYSGGDFSSIAPLFSFNAGSASHNATFTPSADNQITDILVSQSAIYAGGTFTSIGSKPRNFSPLDLTTGQALPNP